jgi:hypothetical protein
MNKIENIKNKVTSLVLVGASVFSLNFLEPKNISAEEYLSFEVSSGRKISNEIHEDDNTTFFMRSNTNGTFRIDVLDNVTKEVTGTFATIIPTNNEATINGTMKDLGIAPGDHTYCLNQNDRKIIKKIKVLP